MTELQRKFYLKFIWLLKSLRWSWDTINELRWPGSKLMCALSKAAIVQCFIHNKIYNHRHILFKYHKLHSYLGLSPKGKSPEKGISQQALHRFQMAPTWLSCLRYCTEIIKERLHIVLCQHHSADIFAHKVIRQSSCKPLTTSQLDSCSNK